jgi:uncharacterized protein DUF6152
MSRSARIFVSSAALLAASVAAAHHAFSPVYDGSKTKTVEGVVTAFKFVNPHTLLELDVPDAAGATTHWTIEFGGKLNLVNAGWSEETITIGEQLAVTGNPTHTGSPRLFFVNIVKADGTRLLPMSQQRVDALQRERLERAQQRATKPEP